MQKPNRTSLISSEQYCPDGVFIISVRLGFPEDESSVERSPLCQDRCRLT